MTRLNTNLVEQRDFARANFPIMLPSIEKLMADARAQYARAGSPNGLSEEAAYAWWAENFEAWRNQRAADEVDAQALRTAQERIDAAVAKGLVIQIDTNVIAFTAKGLLVNLEMAIRQYINREITRGLAPEDLRGLQIDLARGVLIIDGLVKESDDTVSSH